MKVKESLLAVSFLVLLLSGCERHRRLTVEMTWACVPDEYKSWAPDAQPVRFKYVANLHYEEVVAGRGLCDQLKGSGKQVVVVKFEAWGNSRGLVGYREVSVDGKSIVDAAGWAYSSGNTTMGPHPLDKIFKSNGQKGQF